MLQRSRLMLAERITWQMMAADTGLLKLKGLRHLKDLEVHQMGVTEEGIAKLKKLLPDVNVTIVGDL